MYFRVFFKVNIENWDILGGCKNFKSYFELLYIHGFLFIYLFFSFFGGGEG